MPDDDQLKQSASQRLPAAFKIAFTGTMVLALGVAVLVVVKVAPSSGAGKLFVFLGVAGGVAGLSLVVVLIVQSVASFRAIRNRKN